MEDIQVKMELVIEGMESTKVELKREIGERLDDHKTRITNLETARL